MQVVGRQVNLYFWLAILCAAVLAGMLVSSYLTLADLADERTLVPSGQSSAMLIGTLIPALGLIVLFGRRLAIRRAGGTTARLHVNLVFFFSLVAAVPTLLVAVFASFMFQSGVEFWFSSQSRGILESANELARGYYDESQRDVEQETVAMAGDLRFELERNGMTSQAFQSAYSLQVLFRKLNESAILQQQPDGTLRVDAIVDPEEENVDRQRISAVALARLRQGDAVVVTASPERIEAVTAIDRATGLYLYNARNSDALALSQWKRAQSVVQAYDVLTERARRLQLTFNLALLGVSLALVGLAVWFALRFADRQVQPLADLVGAARAIGAGNYAMRVTGRTGPDEIGLLNRAFNRMTQQIERQTDALIGANRQLAERRAFIETVLQSITAGIVSVDAAGTIILMNNSARDLLAEGDGSPVGRPLAELSPRLAELLRGGATGSTVQFNRHGEMLTLAVRLAPSGNGHVITFEDITRQLLDQRQAAWSDVARRIAHEIKNPLTPIQLATERLKRRYRKQILADGELFDDLTGTIIRQVGDLRKMVDEFSSFARLPKPVFRREDAVDLVRQAVFLQEVGNPDIRYLLDVHGEGTAISCDRHQIGQALTNVLKNAAEAIDSRRREGSLPGDGGRIAITMVLEVAGITIEVHDNGIGLPQGGERIMEPYVTTREKGTGLGLAIVKKIVEEHGGEIAFAAETDGGTCATLRLARDPLAVADDGPVVGSEAAE
ncbi:ATPase [Croceibacterium mercuriale]|uniref:histidine kinase n=1 Tax=Croceibacterium mercuriale TaxID=1572751 RepID=A0A0B2BWT1_9SPHN|nr:HAMP domain-containing histidine kinase [Croceibacterium mercuriale]KHL25874.1 ATPase [Croceibacterium mercuriale]